MVTIGRHRVRPDLVTATTAADDDGYVDGGHHLADEPALREVVDEPHPLVVEKVADHVDEVAATFLAAAPLVVVGSGDAAGGVDVSPRGDPAGFVRVLDGGRRLALPERSGNRRIDTLRNVVTAPGLGLLFLVPGVPHALRVNGRGRVVRDPEVLGLWEDPPPLALVVDVEESFVHCGRALSRSGVWGEKPEPAADVPGLKELLDAARAACPREEPASGN
ncbi:pyridoxamine 5'-phosphate oxidase family protein [Actinomycetospora endophytica]|uniref:Pyridoxamine 5'-phosphate oxidase family protein n=1 Tax=Actinomycetospora endophytica TaxID=2291215 RepID=A0ABS8PF02_9PSEU|nr:pyridoxamine 5'-phosphate oxidase family protein [Actinomycetospora endophytica]